MPEIQHRDKTIEFAISYRNRRTLAIQIKPPGSILVMSPLGLSQETVKSMVRSKGDWIIKKLLNIKKIASVSINREFRDGESFLHLGRECFLQIIPDKSLKRPKIRLSDGWLQIITPSEDRDGLKKVLEKWYRKEAEKIITERLDFYRPKLNVEPAHVKVKQQKRRWGSCTPKGDLFFNWRIVMAPLPVVDYIIVHEMSHLIHKNHSARFWKTVEKVLPDYRARRKWLRDHGITMDL